MIVLDASGVTALAYRPSLVAELTIRRMWPPVVPNIVLVECLTGDHQRDHGVDRLLRICELRDVTEPTARLAGALRYRTRRAGEISAVDAAVVAEAILGSGAAVVTSDPSDLAALLAAADSPIAILPV